MFKHRRAIRPRYPVNAQLGDRLTGQCHVNQGSGCGRQHRAGLIGWRETPCGIKTENHIPGQRSGRAGPGIACADIRRAGFLIA